MEERDDYIKCVQNDLTSKTWCGKPIYNFNWQFVDVTHAALNGLQECRLVCCTDCYKNIVKALSNGISLENK